MEGFGFLTTTFGKLTCLDLAIITLYMGLCIVFGLYKAGKIKTTRDFALGSGGISTFVLISTIYATHLGAGLTFGALEKIREMGMLFALSVLALPFGWALKIWIFANNIEQFEGCISQSDIMGKLYGTWGKWAANIALLIVAVGTIAAQVSALGYLLSYYTDMPVSQCILIGMGILIAYSAIGGVRAVVATDVLQFLILYIAIPYLCAAGYHYVGEWEGIKNSVPADKLHINFTTDGTMVLIGCVMYSLLESNDGPFIQRFLMAKNRKQLVTALKVVTILDIFISVLICILGFVVISVLPGHTMHNTGFLELINVLMPIGIKGIVITGLIAVIMSTADSWLNTTSVICAHDIVKAIWPKISQKTELAVARFATLLIGLFAIILALRADNILDIIWQVVNFYDPIMSVPLSVGFLGFRTNSRSFCASIAGAIIATMFAAYLQGTFNLISMSYGLVGSATGLFGMHYYQIKNGLLDRRSMKRKKRSYRVLQPASN
ncbi:MAG: sodium:solute symporter family protein [Proteobacteria bacterium]|nr:sodium:solute symporter family protein [Pseudomonadota bacterium]